MLAYQDEQAGGRNLAEIASTHMRLRGPPPPSRKTGPSCMNDRFRYAQSLSAGTRIAITCRFRKWGVYDGPDSGLKSVIRATIPKNQGGFTPKQDRNPGLNGRDFRKIPGRAPIKSSKKGFPRLSAGGNLEVSAPGIV